MTDVLIDLKNSPFPEYPGGSFAVVFESSNSMTVQGIVTQAPTQIRPSAPVRYFRLDVTDAVTGVVTPWAATFNSFDASALTLIVGDVVRVTGLRTRDGTNRLFVSDPLAVDRLSTQTVR